MPNRLAHASSPYLRQHADNPVDWFPWGDEAFERAKWEDKPILLSVGYSSCHWCHVMAHESFEDPSIGRILDEHFVSIKVDREERPDVDEVYMTAVQLATGRGGWPMTLFLTHDRKPFFAGTYFPREDRGQYPGFRTLLRQVAQGWRDHRDQLVSAADDFATGLDETMRRVVPSGGTELGPELLALALDALHGEFDPDHGGFGGKPKFPPHTALRFLLRLSRSSLVGEVDRIIPGAAELASDMAARTLDKLALGGIHDHVGGGFHRYSTDERWLLPHFEKMLYDNAQLLELAALGGRLVGAEGIVSWIEREMMSPEGLFYSAIDADSEGEEGLFYTWTLEEVRSALGLDLAFETSFGLASEGNFDDEATGRRTGRNVLHRHDWRGDFAEPLARLAQARASRVRPALDDKAIAAWNGMAIVALAPSRRDLAERAARRWAQCKPLPHMIVRGQEIGQAYLDDVAHMGLAFAALGWHEEAGVLADRLLADFRYPSGAFWFTSDAHEPLIGRSMPAIDGSMPSGNAAAVRLLIECGRLEEARAALEALVGWMERVPNGTEALHDAALLYLEKAGLVGSTTAILVQDVVKRDEDGRAWAEIRFEFPGGWHLQGLELTVEGEPAHHTLTEDEGAWLARVGLPIGSASTVELVATWQACTDSVCLPSRSQAFRVSIVD